MKKLFSLLTLALLTMSAWAATEVTINFADLYNTNTMLEDASPITVDGVTLSFEKNGGTAPQYYTNGTNARIYANNKMTVSAAQAITNITFTTSSGNYDWDENSADSGTYADGAWSGNANSIVFTNNTGHQVRIVSMVVTLGGTPAITVAAPTLPNEQTFEESLTVSITNNEEGASLYYSTDGLAWQAYSTPLTITETTTVYAKATKQNVDSRVVSATYTKVDPVADNVVIFDGTVDIPGVTGSAFSLTKGDVTFDVTSGTCQSGTGHYRIFKNQTATFTSAGANIVKIEFNCTTEGDAQSGPGCLAVNDNNGEYTYSGKVGTWVGDAKTVVFNTNKDQARPITIVVTLDDGTTQFVAAPTLPASQTFENTLSVEITNNDADATVYYSFDNTEWTAYVAPIVLNETKTVYAKAVKGTAESSVVSATYTKVEPVVGEAITFVAETDTIEGGTVAGWHEITKGCVTIKFYGTVSNYALYDSLGNVTSEFHEYRIYKNNSIQFTSNGGNIRQIEFFCSSSNPVTGFDDVEGLTVTGDNGVWVGKTRNITFNSNKKQVRCTQIVVTVDDEQPETPPVATPVISPENCKFGGSIEITITCETAGADIYYMINDGDEVLYTGPFTLTETATVKAYADLDGTESDMAQASYTKLPDVATIEEAKALNNKTDFYFTGNVVVVYQDVTSGNLWVKDETGYGLIYGRQVPAFEVGATLNSGWDAQRYLFRGHIIEFQYPNNVTASDAALQTITANKYTEAQLDSTKINERVLIEDLTLTAGEDVKYLYTADGMAIYNQFGITYPAIEEGKTYDVEGMVSYYNNAVQIMPIAVTEHEATEFIRGDVNMDGIVNISDVTALIDYLLTQNSTGLNMDAADTNEDGTVAIGDVTTLIDFLLVHAW